ncbi:MAG: 16S rRNA (cytosine(1402)-N(4))-methyltransferase RsmH [Elusimicrobia bacterium]|nr:16S rRNA (cytosine(1402)-N(4))-methyltransferase RsmH [Elusimicrobiota bacterium]
MTDNLTHEPVLVEETAALLVTDRRGTYVDATVGFGGHAEKIISMLEPAGRLIGIDWDPELIAIAGTKLSMFSPQIKLLEGNFANLDEILARENIDSISGILMDLGVSSLHFDKPSRGFSFRLEGPLDMRINPSNPLTAFTIINKWPYEQIEHLIRICGEKFSARIAKKIVETRKTKQIETTAELRKLIENCISRRNEKIHPATKTFLAFRAAVNHEFENLAKALEKSAKFLKKGSRLAVISFHSIEDRIVKETFKLMKKVGGWKLVTPKPVKPSEKEIIQNHRARSAKLRVIEKE